MRLIRYLIASAATVVCLTTTAAAMAAPITIGSPLVGPFKEEGPSGATVTALNLTLGEAGAHSTSPVSGAIVRWHLLDANGGPFRLRVLRPNGGPVYTAVGSSAPVTALGGGYETFSTSLPVQAGDTIGLDLPEGAKLGVYLAGPTSSVAAWKPPLPEGATQPYSLAEAGGEYGFNAEVQPQPTVTAVSPASGTFKGSSAVTIAGTDFAAVSGVRFGGNAAISFAVGSENQITAVAPPGTPGNADITVTTVAGTSPVSPADRFTYTACVVPKLNAKKLKAAKKKLKNAGCKVGKVTKEDGVSAKAGKIVGQSPKPGRKLKPGTKVNVILG
jgi:hypothetical protein